MTKQCQFRRIKVRKRTKIGVHVVRARNIRTAVERTRKSLITRLPKK